MLSRIALRGSTAGILGVMCGQFVGGWPYGINIPGARQPRSGVRM
jgi:hypothetical protein